MRDTEGGKFEQVKTIDRYKAKKTLSCRKRDIPLLSILSLFFFFLQSSSKHTCLFSFPLKHTVKKAGSGVRLLKFKP